MTNLLISAPDLHTRLEDDTVIIDTRWYIDDPAAGRKAYTDAHIPGARFADLNTDLSQPTGPGRHPLPTHQKFGETCERLGIDSSVDVVVYDDSGGAIAARLWWMLTNQGHPAVAVLDGGLEAWAAIDGPLTSALPTVTQTTFPTKPWTATVDRHEVESRPASAVLIDARARERYLGDEEPIDPVAGHIPGALSMPFEENLAVNMTFLPPDRLRRRFAAAGINNHHSVISQCGSGVTACHNILAMAVAGMATADLYVGSWSDWSTQGLPAAVGIPG